MFNTVLQKMKFFIYIPFLFCLIFTITPTKSTDSEETFYISLKGVDKYDAPKEGAKVILDKTIFMKSFCIRYYVPYMSVQTIFFSNDNQLAFAVNYEENFGFFLINGKWQIFSTKYQPVPFVYEHVCVTHNETHYIVAGEGSVWFQSPFSQGDKPDIKKSSNIKEIYFGPMSPTFTGVSNAYFRGKVSELNIFSNSFSEEELMEMTGSCAKIENGTKVFDWSQVQISDIVIPENLVSYVKLKTKSYDNICSRKKSKKIDIIPFPNKMEVANRACTAWGAKIFMPETEDDLKKMSYFKTLGGPGSVLTNFTTADEHCKDSVWLPLYKLGESSWASYENRSEKIVPKLPIFEDGKTIQNCSVNSPIGSKHFEDIPCSRKICVFCIWTVKISFKLRGLCSRSKVERNYVLTNELHNKGFLGIL